VLLGTLLVTGANKIANLKQTIKAQDEMLSKVGVVGPFKMHQHQLLAKVGKEAIEVSLEHSQQEDTWNSVVGNSMIESWSISTSGIQVKQKKHEASCKTEKGMDSQSSVTLLFTCAEWPIKTGYEAEGGTDQGFEPRVRFWHRCDNDKNDNLSLCNKYNYIGADSMGYYGCQYLTSDGYCVKSFRHEWVEFSPNDLPFAYNPASPCDQPNALGPCGPPAGRYIQPVAITSA